MKVIGELDIGIAFTTSDVIGTLLSRRQEAVAEETDFLVLS